MFKSVNHVLVGNKFTTKTDIKAVADGEFVMVDTDQNILDPTAPIASTVKGIMIGVAHGTQQIVDPATGTLITVPNIQFGNVIRRGDKGTSIFNAFAASVKASSIIDTTAIAITAGDKKDYAVRILYKDIEPAAVQTTKTYNIYDVTSDTDFNDKLIAVINKDQKTRVVAQTNASGVELVAKDIIIENDIDEFSMVELAVSVYEVPTETGIFNRKKIVAEGVVVITNEPFYGIGNPIQVRDMERKYRGYKGIVYSGAYPTIEGTQWTNFSKTYDEVTINYESLYRSNDNQYVKTTPITYTLYVEKGNKGADVASTVKDFISNMA